jgi:hypothetical protein
MSNIGLDLVGVPGINAAMMSQNWERVTATQTRRRDHTLLCAHPQKVPAARLSLRHTHSTHLCIVKQRLITPLMQRMAHDCDDDDVEGGHVHDAGCPKSPFCGRHARKVRRRVGACVVERHRLEPERVQ